jgi:hypothetical protein
MPPPSARTGYSLSGFVAGPFCTDPSAILNSLPWQGHLITPFDTPPTVQPWWVHTAVNALKAPWLGWVTTTFSAALTLPPPTGTSAAFAIS